MGQPLFACAPTHAAAAAAAAAPWPAPHSASSRAPCAAGSRPDTGPMAGGTGLVSMAVAMELRRRGSAGNCPAGL